MSYLCFSPDALTLSLLWRRQPFFGPLIRLSEGRSIRELVFGMLLIPAPGQLGPLGGLSRLGVVVDETERSQALLAERAVSISLTGQTSEPRSYPDERMFMRHC